MTLASSILLRLLCICLALRGGRGQAAGGPIPLQHTAPEECSAMEFYQSGNLSCVQCGQNQLSTQNGFSCSCVSGYRRAIGETSSLFPCQPCGASQVTSRDGLFCLACEPPLSFDSGSAIATCDPCSSPTEIYVDTLPLTAGAVGSRACVPCPEGTWADASGFQCVECGVEDCQLCSPSMVSGGVCFPSVPALPQPPAGVFPYYAQHFSAAAELCENGNQTACQLVANLCVLQTYSRSDPACQRAMQQQGNLLPALYYPEGRAGEILSSTEIGVKLTARGSDEASSLSLVLVTFDLSGRLLGVEPVSEQLLLCRERPSRASAAWRVGVHYDITCTVSVTDLSVVADSPLFYDLYLREQEVGGDQLHPLPVLVANYRNQAGIEVNRGSSPRNWQLVRRFFLAESLTDSPMYARTMELRVELDSDGTIFTPYLYISYGSWTPSTISSDRLQASFATEYSQDRTGFAIGLAVTASVLALIAAVLSAFRMNGFLRRTGALCCELHSFVFLAVELSGSISTAIFLLLSFAAAFWLIFFKAQSTFFLALPLPGLQEVGFVTLLVLALVCRVIHIAYLVWHQCTVDIFLIDWERSRGVLLTTNQNPESIATPTTVTAPVSIWRTYFVANEWNEIQSLRKLNPTLLLLLVLLFLNVVGIEILAERDPSSHVREQEDRYSAPHSAILRFSLTSLTYIIIAVILRLVMFLVYERFFEHQIRQFVDLCSVSNVSMFIMSRKRFGYYIHGRSVHGHADTNMREMNYNLHKEQENLCGQRGLLADSDEQTFEMALPQQFRVHYDQLVMPIQAERAEGQAQTAAGQQRGQATGAGGLSEASLKAYEELNQFLSAFIERSLRDLDYVVKDKLFLERVLGVEFYDAADRALFYHDPGCSFDSVLFYGNEWALLQLDILVFAVVDLLSQSYVLAAIITYLISWMLSFIRDTYGKRNLGKKTLVDDRFLI